MSSPERSTPDPDPAVTAGQPGPGVEPGDTPPSSDSMSATVNRDQLPNMGPVSGNRTPMFIALGAIGVIVLMVGILIVASFVAS